MARAGRLHILEVQRLIRFMPKPVICLVNGWAAGGGHSLHVVCDLTLASREHARFKQTDADRDPLDRDIGVRNRHQHQRRHHESERHGRRHAHQRHPDP